MTTKGSCGKQQPQGMPPSDCEGCTTLEEQTPGDKKEEEHAGRQGARNEPLSGKRWDPGSHHAREEHSTIKGA